MNNKKNKVLCIVGPTASGKTALAAAIAEKYGGTIRISAAGHMFELVVMIP